MPLLLGLLLALLAAAPAQGAVRLERVGEFASPTYVTGAPGDHGRLYVTEQSGRIHVVRNGAKRLFADLTSAVRDDGNEEGLLSIAFPPNFGTSRLLYAFVNNSAGNVEIVQLRAASADRADPAYLRRVLEIPHQEAPNHNGGQLQFGRDGALYASTGDGGNGYDTPTRDAQNPGSLLGKILRISPTPGGGRRIPPGNPFGNEVWAYGLRNPFRFSFDRATGDLILGDVGQNFAEEVDFVPAPAGAGRGANFQWDECEGTFDAEPGPTVGAPCSFSGGVGPVLQKRAADGWCSLIGGYVVRHASLPTLRGRYVYGDFCLGQLRSVSLSGSGATGDGPIGVDVQQLTSFGEDAAGCVYAASRAGPVYKLVENDARIPCAGPGDATPPTLKVRVKRRQKVRRRRPAIAYARCSERCRVRMVAKLVVGKRKYRLRSRTRRAAANQRIKLRGRLTRRAARRLRRALDADRRTRIRVAIRARDSAGNVTRYKRRRIRVRD